MVALRNPGAMPSGRAGKGLIFDQVAGLAAQRLADRFQRREADGAGLAGLEDRQVGERDVDLLGQLSQRHPPLVKQLVELDQDRHQIVPSRSSRISVPSANTRARTKVRITQSHPLIENPASRCSGNSFEEMVLPIPPMTMLSRLSATNIQAIACRR